MNKNGTSDLFLLCGFKLRFNRSAIRIDLELFLKLNSDWKHSPLFLLWMCIHAQEKTHTATCLQKQEGRGMFVDLCARLSYFYVKTMQQNVNTT